MKKKILSVVLALCMMVGVVPSVGLLTLASDQGYTFNAVETGLSSFAIDSNKSLWGWGLNYMGFLGDGTTDNRTKPVKIMDDVKSISVASGTGMAVKTDSSLWAWGANNNGQIGDGTCNTFDADGYRSDDANKLSPVKIMDNVVSVSVGWSHTMAITEDGALWAWGTNNKGQLGNGTTKNSYKPIKIMDNAAFVSAGWDYSMAIKTDGSLWAWGDNSYNSLGDGTSKDRLSPVEIMDNVESVSAGGYHTMAIKTDGGLWAWGVNDVGQLGDGTVSNWPVVDKSKSSPVKIMDDVAYVAAGATDIIGSNIKIGYTLAVKTDGSLWSWGGNGHGQLGDGTRTTYNYETGIQDINDRYDPVKIMDGVSTVAGGSYHGVAVKKDGSLWVWGENGGGYLGVGSENFIYSPVQLDISKLGQPVVTPIEFAFGDGAIGGYSVSPDVLEVPSSINGETVTTINGYALRGTFNRVILPNTITTIRDSAFDGSPNLTSINLPSSVNYIGDFAFKDCVSLGSIDIPNCITKIAYNTFFNCASLTEVTIPRSVTLIDSGAFEKCTSLNRIILPNSLVSIGNNTFRNSGLTEINIPGSVKVIGDFAFSENYNLGKVFIPESITYMEGGVFDNSPNVTIYSKRGSYAHTYALSKNIKWIDPNGTLSPISEKDKPSTWAIESINRASALSLVPDLMLSKYSQPTTREEFCALAVKLVETVKGKEIVERQAFSDTTDINVQKMGGLGVVSGVGSNKFSPEGIITREQSAVILANLIKALGKPLDEKSPTFADNADISPWAVSAVGQVQAAGIMGGVGNNTFMPKNTYTREQSIATLLRLFDMMSQ